MSHSRSAPTHLDMRIASAIVLAAVFACSSTPDVPGGGQGSAGSNSAGGAMSSGGSMMQPNGGSVMTGGSAMQSGGGSTMMGGSAPQSNGGSTTMGGRPNGGAGGGPGTGGASGGSAGSGGASGCVKNLACKLDPPPSSGDLQQDCVDRINQFLTQCACLPALKRRTDGEDCANQMAKYDADHDMAHAGVKAMICEPAGSQNSCPGYASTQQVIGLCLQQMWDEGPPPTAECTGDCYQMHGHFINMTDDSVTQVACGFYTTPAGKVWAVQNFSR